jgi:hypothetical protein
MGGKDDGRDMKKNNTVCSKERSGNSTPNLKTQPCNESYIFTGRPL